MASLSAAWVFGYGSLVWKPSFEYKRSIKGYIKGWRRVWWQGSTDHRGTPERPGRTVTLCEDPAAITWGVAYELDGSPEQQQATLSYLEWREKQYDVRCRTTLYSKEASKSKPTLTGLSADDDSHGEETVPDCLVYIAGPDLSRNANYLGPAPLDTIADQIANSTGPSGHNSEYLFKLAAAMRAMDVHDDELFSLEVLVQERMARDFTNINV